MKVFDQNVYNEIFNTNQYTTNIKVNNKDTVLDLGCSKGYLYFKCVEENLNINYIGVDASIFNIQDFVTNLDGNNSPVLLNVALNNSLEVLDFSCIYHIGKHQLVQSITFQNLLKLINKPIDFLKFDIEGFEKYIFEDYDLFKSKINKFSGELHFSSDILSRDELLKILEKLKEDPDIEYTLFSLDMINITETLWDNKDYYDEILINGQLF